MCGISCMDLKEHCARNHQVFNIFVLEFEYSLRFTLDNDKYIY